MLLDLYLKLYVIILFVCKLYVIILFVKIFV